MWWIGWGLIAAGGFVVGALTPDIPFLSIKCIVMVTALTMISVGGGIAQIAKGKPRTRAGAQAVQ